MSVSALGWQLAQQQQGDMSLNKKKKMGVRTGQPPIYHLPPLMKVRLDGSLCHLGHSLARPRVFCSAIAVRQ